MSRFEVAFPEDGLLVVGWDPPLQSFYGQVFPAGALASCRDSDCWNEEPHVRRDCNDDWPEPWVGCLHGELPTVERLVEALGEYGRHVASVTADLKAAQARNK